MEEALTLDYKIVSAIAAAVAAVVGVLWREIKTHHKHYKEELSEQRKKNDKHEERLLGLTKEVGEMSGYKDGVEDIATALIKEIKEKM